MNSRKNLAAQVAGAMAIAALMGTSAFAETRHLDATDRDRATQSSDDRSHRFERRDRSGSENQNQTHERRDTTTTAPQTSERRDSSRNSGTWNRNESRNNDNRTWNRNESRNNGSLENRSQA